MNSRKFAMNYGAVLGLCLVAISAVMWSFGIDKNGSLVPSILNNGFIIAGIVYTIIQFRDTENSGFISYGDSLKLGTSVAFFSSVILTFYTFIFINYITVLSTLSPDIFKTVWIRGTNKIIGYIKRYQFWVNTTKFLRDFS